MIYTTETKKKIIRTFYKIKCYSFYSHIPSLGISAFEHNIHINHEESTNTLISPNKHYLTIPAFISNELDLHHFESKKQFMVPQLNSRSTKIPFAKKMKHKNILNDLIHLMLWSQNIASAFANKVVPHINRDRQTHTRLTWWKTKFKRRLPKLNVDENVFPSFLIKWITA